jgi:hypothetical protein
VQGPGEVKKKEAALFSLYLLHSRGAGV